MVKIILVRHAQPEWTPEGKVSNDPTLTALGYGQATRLEDRRWGHIDQLWTSPYARARLTAAPVGRSLALEPVLHDWMAEIGPAHEWDGSPIEELEEMFNTVNHRPIDELWDGMPGAESFRDFHLRVTHGLDSMLSDIGMSRYDDSTGLWNADPGINVVMVAHGGTNAVVIGHLLGVEATPWEWDRFDSAHTSVATLTTRHIAHGWAFGMVGFGDVTHLDHDMVSR